MFLTNEHKRGIYMEQKNMGFLILAVLSLLVAGVLTWALLNPKEVTGEYDYSIGSLPKGPTSNAVGRAVIKFEKTEDDTNG